MFLQRIVETDRFRSLAAPPVFPMRITQSLRTRLNFPESEYEQIPGHRNFGAFRRDR